VRLILRIAIGLVAATFGLTCFVYGLAQSVNVGSCGGYRAACPSGTGPMIVLMVFGCFVALGGAALAGVFARFMFVFFIAAIAGVVFGFVDIDDTDTRPGYEVLIAVVAPMVLIVLPGVGRERQRPAAVRMMQTPQAPQAAQAPAANFGVPPKWQPREQPTTAAGAEDIASRLRQLDQLKSSGLLGEQEYAERRKQILAEL
jgi:hypothetical protein